MYLKSRTKLRLHFNHSLDDFSEDVYLPNEGHQIKRSPMRRRYNKEGQNPWTEWYSDLGHGCDDYRAANRMINGFIRKNVGNKFDGVFHEFMSKARVKREIRCYGYHTPESMFLDYFEKEERLRAWKTYYIDDDGIIRQIPKEPRRLKDIIIYKKGPIDFSDRYIYTLREDNLLSISIPFTMLFGRDLYNEILRKKTFTEYSLRVLRHKMNKLHSDDVIDEVFNSIRKYREYRLFYGSYNTKLEQYLFSSKYNNIERIIKYGTKEFLKYWREKKRLKALAIKEKRHPDRTEYDFTLKRKKIQRNNDKRAEKLSREGTAQGEM